VNPPIAGGRGEVGPLIGISTYSVDADWKVWRGHSGLTPRTYTNCVLRCGAVPLLLPAVPAEPSLVERILEPLDGIVLIGGEDVCGVFSGREESEAVHAHHSEERDAFEIALAQSAWERDLPALGICRGAQVLNVARGGTLIEDLPTAGAADYHLLDRGSFNPHPVEFEQGTTVSGLFGPSTVVPSHHHQAIDELGEGLIVSGRAEDSVIESVEAPGKHFFVGVQWHPEEGEDMTIFEALVEATAVRA